ncbi:MAG: (d)CMP kinase [Phycisphaerales bacterium]|nr:(d)CMP kinase [Phycisphaerales bacterium]
MIITIDGPAGSGKSTAARKLAARLEIPYLDTGAMYRALAYAALQRGVDFERSDSLAELARSVRLEVDCGPTHTRVRVDGHDVSEALRDPKVSEVTPFVARVQAIRDMLVLRQRQIGAELGSLVTEGRDQGSVVFPYADVKFVLDASVQKRAERRVQELVADGHDVSLQSVMQNLTTRDGIDSRQWAPLLPEGVAIIIDTTEMKLSDVVERLEKEVRARVSANSP